LNVTQFRQGSIVSEQPKRDFTHVRFPEVGGFQTSREALNRKLSEINAAFEEIERRRGEQQEAVAQEEANEAGEAEPGDVS
jgi:hypothetical protein